MQGEYFIFGNVGCAIPLTDGLSGGATAAEAAATATEATTAMETTTAVETTMEATAMKVAAQHKAQ